MTAKNLKYCLIMLIPGLIFFSCSRNSGSGSSDLLRGREIVIGNFWQDWDVNTYEPWDAVSEEQLEFRRKALLDHGVIIREKYFGWDGYVPNITTGIMAGNPDAQAYYLIPEWGVSLQKQGLLAPLSDSKAVDLTTTEAIALKQVQYNPDIASTFTFDGKQYAFAIGFGATQHSANLFFNKRLFREAGLDPELPYDMQKDGSWNWDNFFEISKRLTRDRSNTGRIDTWAMTADNSAPILEAFVFSNGGDFVSKDENGRFVNAASRPEFLEAMNFVRRLVDEGVLMPRPAGSDWDWFWVSFIDGMTAMLLDPEWRVNELNNVMKDDWGAVLAPKGPRMNDYRTPQDDNVIVVPSTYKGADLDAILTAVDLWYKPIITDWKMGKWAAYNDRRAVDETLERVFNPGWSAFRYHMLIPGLQIETLANPIWEWEGDPAQLVEQVSTNWNALIADANR